LRNLHSPDHNIGLETQTFDDLPEGVALDAIGFVSAVVG